MTPDPESSILSSTSGYPGARSRLLECPLITALLIEPLRTDGVQLVDEVDSSERAVYQGSGPRVLTRANKNNQCDPR